MDSQILIQDLWNKWLVYSACKPWTFSRGNTRKTIYVLITWQPFHYTFKVSSLNWNITITNHFVRNSAIIRIYNFLNVPMCCSEKTISNNISHYHLNTTNFEPVTYALSSQSSIPKRSSKSTHELVNILTTMMTMLVRTWREVVLNLLEWGEFTFVREKF